MCIEDGIIDVWYRIFNFFDEIINNYQDQDILIVTHAGVSIYAKVYFEGEPIDNNYEDLKIKNGQVLIYENSKIKKR